MQTTRPIDLNFLLPFPPLVEEAAAVEADAIAGVADADATIAADVLLEMEMEAVSLSRNSLHLSL